MTIGVWGNLPVLLFVSFEILRGLSSSQLRRAITGTATDEGHWTR